MWADSMGSVGTGTAWYDDKTDAWHLWASSSSFSGKASAKGQVKFTDPETMEWQWTEYGRGSLVKTLELTGPSRRQ